MIAVEQAAVSAPAERLTSPWWRRLALGAICVLAAALYLWGIGDSWGNAYYSAAVKSMSQNFENFLFGSFDPAGVVTVDKPPMALWAQVLSAKVFGFSKFSVLFPQVVFGVLAVFTLHRTVRRWAGENAALIAALVLAVTPITVMINRDNNPDTLLVLLVVAAAYAMTRAFEGRRSTSWIALAALLVGCGFLTKMLQAWMVVPAFGLAYLMCAPRSWGRRFADLGVAAVVLLVTSFWWAVLTQLWPSPKPYIGGSTDGNALDLIFGYNGFGRILGGAGNGHHMGHSGGSGGGPGGGGPGGGGGFAGTPGIGRMFGEQLAGQISWLLPLCALLLVTMLVVGIRHWRGGKPMAHETTAGWVLWGGWLVVLWVMFSLAQGTMHPYYTTMMAPAIGAITGAGLVQLWKRYRQPGWSWVLLPIAVAVTVAWAMVVVAHNLSWHPWAGYLAVGLGVLAVIGLLAGRARRGVAKAGLALGLAAMLTVPTAWSAIGAVSGGNSMMGGANPTAGPDTMSRQLSKMFSEMREKGGLPDMPGGPGAQNGPGGMPPSGMGGPGGLGRMRGMGEGKLSADQQKLLDYVKSTAGGKDIPLAIDGGAMGASSYVLNSDLTVVGMGGFIGSDNAPSVQQLTQWKNQGKLGFVLLGGGFGGGMHFGDRPGGQQGPGQSHGGMGGMPGGQLRTEREQWVKQNCTKVDPAAFGASADSGMELYRCS